MTRCADLFPCALACLLSCLAPVAQVRAYIDEVMDIVDLIDIQYGFVGQPGLSGLSVEQRKRLTIAVELVAK